MRILSALKADMKFQFKQGFYKVISLSFLAEVAGFAIALGTYKDSFNWILLFLGIFLTAAFFTLYGFVVAVGCSTINQYFIKMVPYMLALIIPTLLYFSFPNVWILQLLPSAAAFNLVYRPFNGIELLKAMSYISYLLVINLVILIVVEKMFVKKLLRGE